MNKFAGILSEAADAGELVRQSLTDYIVAHPNSTYTDVLGEYDRLLNGESKVVLPSFGRTNAPGNDGELHVH